MWSKFANATPALNLKPFDTNAPINFDACQYLTAFATEKNCKNGNMGMK